MEKIQKMDKNFENLVSHLPRLSWQEVFMAMACVYAMRSPDGSTRHGCIIINRENVPVGFGYNGFPKGGKNDDIYDKGRPGKYKVIAHSELNALLNRSLNDSGGTVYVTGKPCCGCMVAMIQGGIKTVVYGKIGSHCVSEEDWTTTQLMAENCGITLVEYQLDPQKALLVTGEYLRLKGWESEKEEFNSTN